MKKLIGIAFLFQVFLTFGQDVTKLGKSFEMKSNYCASTCDGVGGNPGTTEMLERNFIIVVEAITETDYIVSVPKFNPDSSKYNLRFNKTANGDDIYFMIPFKDFEKYCELLQLKGGFTVGIPTIPTKLRFGNGGTCPDKRFFRFEGNVSLGLSGGYKRSFGNENQYAWNIVVGFTVASVPVDSVTTKGVVNSNTSAASFSPHFGIVLDVQKVQFGIYSGIDFLNGEPNKYWVYENQPWLGIGFGYSLLKADDKSPSSPQPKER
jgi:hypothetical protein